jgi:hypothetical protein
MPISEQLRDKAASYRNLRRHSNDEDARKVLLEMAEELEAEAYRLDVEKLKAQSGRLQPARRFGPNR